MFGSLLQVLGTLREDLNRGQLHNSFITHDLNDLNFSIKMPGTLAIIPLEPMGVLYSGISTI